MKFFFKNYFLVGGTATRIIICLSVMCRYENSQIFESNWKCCLVNRMPKSMHGILFVVANWRGWFCNVWCCILIFSKLNFSLCMFSLSILIACSKNLFCLYCVYWCGGCFGFSINFVSLCRHSTYKWFCGVGLQNMFQ